MNHFTRSTRLAGDVRPLAYGGVLPHLAISKIIPFFVVCNIPFTRWVVFLFFLANWSGNMCVEWELTCIVLHAMRILLLSTWSRFDFGSLVSVVSAIGAAGRERLRSSLFL